VKIICAWCHALIGYKCPSCGDPLVDPDDPKLRDTHRVCHGSQPLGYIGARSHPTSVLYSIAAMQLSHGMCTQCRHRIDARRARQDARLMTSEDRANAEAEATPTPKKGVPPTPPRGSK
jgi:hypothetical protein